MKMLKQTGRRKNLLREKCPDRRLLLQALKNAGIILLLADLFYDHLFCGILLFPGFILLMRRDIKKNRMQREALCIRQFQDMLILLSQNLQAGSAVENAFVNAQKEIAKLYSAETAFMRALRNLVQGLQINIPVEKLVQAMAEETDHEEIRTFSFVFGTAKRSGGDLVETIAFSATTLIDKIKLNREMTNIISAKRMEQQIMSLIPMGILGYIKLCCPTLIDALYNNLPGAVIMTVFLLIYAGAWLWSGMIIDIKV